ncbi:hypothetical protein LQ772_06915 [Frateuria edaphi]|uniref:hypothetical protein n=1 Tax=Frateuria edaphi TaxID=2898793 RepID=UPI001E656DC1|nr:hypothetical protein [Frateuria edaphi]UGB47017.1 hypothetical protein LQ772_06915 [Frateuria edaphi]
MSNDPTPDPEPMFEAIRDHLKRSRATGFVLHDEAGGYYVAVDESREMIAHMVTTRPDQLTPYTGND